MSEASIPDAPADRPLPDAGSATPSGSAPDAGFASGSAPDAGFAPASGFVPDVGTDGASGDPSPETVRAIDEAAAASIAAPEDVDAQERLWRAVFSLERWVFIARGGDDEPTPFALSTDEGPVIFAFSTAERARSAGIGFGVPDHEASRLLAVPLPSAAAWVASYAESGVEALVFDAPTIGAMAPLSNLAAMAVYISQNPTA